MVESENKESTVDVAVIVEDSFQTEESDGFSLDYIQKVRTGDNIRKNFLSKLTYQKIWLTP